MGNLRVCGIIMIVMGGVKKIMKNVKTWQLGLILIPLLFIAATLLRFDHLKMIELRDKVLEADASENDEEIAKSLAELREFAGSHIVVNVVEKNGDQKITFGTGPFYLEHQYLRKATERLAEAQRRADEMGDSNPNGNIYQKAREVCEPQAQINGWAWNSQENLNCWTTELAKYPTSDSLTTELKADLPNTNLYRYDFASPIWAPTLAGLVILICLVLIVVIFIRVFIWVILSISVKIIK